MVVFSGHVGEANRGDEVLVLRREMQKGEHMFQEEGGT